MAKRRTKGYLKKEKKECSKCHRHSRDVRLRMANLTGDFKTLCNNCVGRGWNG